MARQARHRILLDRLPKRDKLREWVMKPKRVYYTPPDIDIENKPLVFDYKGKRYTVTSPGFRYSHVRRNADG